MSNTGRLKNQDEIDQILDNQPFGFQEAVMMMFYGKAVKRAAWKDIISMHLQQPDEHSKMKRAYFYIIGLDNQAVPYSLQADDVLTKDWIIAQ